MRHYCKPALIVFLFGTLVFGAIYPLSIWCISHLFFPWQAEGSPFICRDILIGFKNMGQPFSNPAYFWPRPVAEGVSVFASGGSNLSWSQPELRRLTQERAETLRKSGISEPIPEDLLMASASGLDPEISVASALAQAARIARSRGVTEAQITYLILDNQESTVLELFPHRVNVLRLNCELDKRYH